MRVLELKCCAAAIKERYLFSLINDRSLGIYSQSSLSRRISERALKQPTHKVTQAGEKRHQSLSATSQLMLERFIFAS